MKIREILQIELWSKETTRKVLRPVGRFLKRTAIVLGILVVLAGTAFEIESHWLTGGERKAGRVALAQIEKLEELQIGVGEVSDENADWVLKYDAAEQQAKSAVSNA
jgi:hypothetical protein